MFFKKISVLIFSFTLLACQNLKTRHDLESNKSKQTPEAMKSDSVVTETQTTTTQQISPPPEQAALIGQAQANEQMNKPKIALILGPGGIRSYAHIGVLQELAKAKIPIAAISGLEMGSLIAAIYAKKAQANDVEWQMMKLKEEEFIKKNLVLSRTPNEVSNLNAFLQQTFAQSSVEDAKVNFSCPAFHVGKRQIFVMNRGPFTSLLPFCIPYYPFFKPYQQNIAGLSALVTTVKHLKAKGIEYMVYIDLLNEKSVPFFQKTESEENVIWSQVAQGLDQQFGVVNKVVQIPLRYYDMDDFSKRRDMIQVGQEAGKNLVKELQNELGF